MSTDTHLQHPTLPYALHIGDRCIAVADLHDASAAYQDARDLSGKGHSEWPEGRVTLGQDTVARVSYNGRVWPPTQWIEGDVPLLEPA